MNVSTTTTAPTGQPTPSDAPVGPTPSRVLAHLATGAAAAATAAIVLAGFLDPGYSSLSEGISALASQESGAAPVMIFGFIAMAVMLLAAGVTLFRADGNLRQLEEIEADVIRLAIGHYRGRMTEVARRLGIGRSTLYRKLGELGIDNAA